MEIAPPDPDAVAAMWASYAAATGHDGPPADVFAFGDSAAMADELAGLVLAGVKRATAGSVRALAEAGVEVRVGDLNVVHDGSGAPVCVTRTSEVRVGPMTSVDDAFAHDEGEGDRTRSGWLAGHLGYFTRTFAREGWEADDDPVVLFERFSVVWPPEVADRTS